MADIWLFNAIAKRRRSAGDTFFENGLAVLAAHLEGNGHSVRIIDWATEHDYADLTPGFLARPIRRLTASLLRRRREGKSGLVFKLLLVASLLMQGIQDRVLARRMRRRLKAVAREVCDADMKLFGIKVWYGEAFEWAEVLCRYIHRASPGTVVIAGGHQPTLYMEEFLSRTSFDLAVVSQGELPMTILLDMASEMTGENRFSRDGFVTEAVRRAGAGELKNLLYRDGGAIRATERYPRINGGEHLPEYGRDTDKVRIHVVIESLGCTWGKCHFCVHNRFYDGYTPRDIDDLVREIEHVRNQGVGIFRFAGSDTPPDFGRDIGRAIIDRGIAIEFGMGSRAVKGIREPEIYRKTVEAYEVLIRAGLRAVFMGGETGHAWVNEEVMNKGLHPEEVALTANALREAERNVGTHVDMSLALIYPTPRMGRVTHEEVFDSDIALIRQVDPDSVMVTPPAPFIGTCWNREAARFGFEIDDDAVDRAIRYEYVLYKPLFLWKKVPFRMDGESYTKKVMPLCGKLRMAVENDLDIPTDLSDEHFLMLRAAGFKGADGAREFKELTTLDLVSGDYARIRDIAKKVNDYSIRLSSNER